MAHSPSLFGTVLRNGAIAFAGASLALIAHAQLSAQTIAGFDADQPVDYAADRIELQDRENRVVLSGNVAIKQGDLALNAGRTIVDYSDAGSLEIQRITATGGVQVSRGGESARGNVGVYDFNRRIITLVGDVTLRRNSDTLRGGRLVIDLDSGVSSVDGATAASSSAVGDGEVAGSRVSGSFTVPDR